MSEDHNNQNALAFQYGITPGTHQWYPSDTESLYNTHIENSVKREILQENGWYPLHNIEQFNYTINSHGFRTHEFPTQKEPDSIITLGCSLTMGIGIPNEYVWPVLLEKDLNRKVYNLGIGGKSTETAFRYLHAWLPIIQSKTVIYAQHPGKRREYWCDKNNVWLPIGHWDGSEISKVLLNVKEWSMAQERAIWAMKGLCSQYGAEFYHVKQVKDIAIAKESKYFGVKFEFNKNKVKHTPFPENEGLHLYNYKGAVARDLEHPGTNYQQRMFENVLNYLG